MIGALKRGRFRSLASLILVVNVVGELQQKEHLRHRAVSLRQHGFLVSNVYIVLIVQGVPPLGGVKQWWGGKTSYFESKCVNILKIVGDIRPKLLYTVSQKKK